MTRNLINGNRPALARRGTFLEVSMSPNERIVAAAWRAVLNQLNGLPTRPGWCLQAVRVIVEAALGFVSPSSTV